MCKLIDLRIIASTMEFLFISFFYTSNGGNLRLIWGLRQAF
ncbi:unnamed protein product [Staurois parvus]|uniref:Uncharacterized protein n=1 Tax=Staurois parvus TaxID=386267 RepID=A0ABN9D0M9_9NEOB|nr:unnamed protein product [Staurois parvus]